MSNQDLIAAAEAAVLTAEQHLSEVEHSAPPAPPAPPAPRYRPVGGAEIARYLAAKGSGLTALHPTKAEVDAHLAKQGA